MIFKYCCSHISSVRLEACGFALHPGDQADIVEELGEGALPEDNKEEDRGEDGRGAAVAKGPVGQGCPRHQPD